MVYVQGIVVDADRFIFNLSRKFLNELTTKGNEILRETIPANRNGLDIRDLVFRENHEAQKLADDYGFSLEALFDEIKGMDYPLRKENLGTEIKKAVNEATEWNEINGIKFIDDCISGLEKNGVKVVTLSSQESQKWLKIMEAVYAEQSKEIKSLMQKIED